MGVTSNQQRHSERSARWTGGPKVQGALTGDGSQQPTTEYDPAADNVDNVLAWVADHPDLAATVLAAEVAGKNRKGIVDKLSAAAATED